MLKFLLNFQLNMIFGIEILIRRLLLILVFIDDLSEFAQPGDVSVVRRRTERGNTWLKYDHWFALLLRPILHKLILVVEFTVFGRVIAQRILKDIRVVPFLMGDMAVIFELKDLLNVHLTGPLGSLKRFVDLFRILNGLREDDIWDCGIHHGLVGQISACHVLL